MAQKLSIKILLIIIMLISTVTSTIAGEQVTFYHTDHVGTPLAITDSTGAVVWQADYKPFGEEHTVTNNAGNNKRFVGKEKDTESGFSYFDARYEDAKTGRFISVDPVGAVNPQNSKTNEELLGNPQRLNSYAYGLNNPYRFVDEDGKNPVLIGIGVIAIRASQSSAVQRGATVLASNVRQAATFVSRLNGANSNFNVASSKFDYFFGRVVTGPQHNIERSAQNLRDLTTLGIENQSQLMNVFNKAMEAGNVISTKTNSYGTSIMKSVNVGNQGSVGVSFFYPGGNMSSTPTVTTIIPKIFKQ